MRINARAFLPLRTVTKGCVLVKIVYLRYTTISKIPRRQNAMNFNRSAKKKMSFERFLSYEYAGDYILSLNYYQVDQGNVKTSDNDKMSVLSLY